MKTIFKILLISFILTSTFMIPVKGQFYYNIGYNAGFPKGLDSLNYIIDRYNETRNYLTEPMEHITFLDGFNFSTGFMYGPVLFELGYSAGIQRRYAEGVDFSQQLIRRELKVSTHSFDIDLGLAFMKPSKGGIFLGGSFNLGIFNVKTRAGIADEIRKEDWVKINPYDGFICTFGLFARVFIGNPGFYIQPYYQFTPGIVFNNDLTDVNKSINPYTFQNDPSPLYTNGNVWGIKFGFTLNSIHK